MALNITLTSISNIGNTNVRVNFSADHHWSAWWDADAVETPTKGGDSWHLGGSAGSQWMNLFDLNSGTSYTVFLRGKHDSGTDEWENSFNTLEFSTSVEGGGEEDPPGKATTPTPTDDQENLLITGKDNLKQLSWVAPAGETPDYSVYLRAQGDSWVLQENIPYYLTSHTLSSTVLDALAYYSIYEWRVDTVNDIGITTGDTWTFITQQENRPTAYTRRSDYDEDTVWQPSTQSWVAPNTFEYTGGGRYKGRVVVIGHKIVYFGDI